ncbi:flagellar export protein FliJ [Treponema zioleckii]|uniref:flagellar export protein FliJ n=1 Tax=Treponema zioleckii TaxID=331680 RepID=UPI00168B6B49|nr:flagellar export protein FliJ [Treponema zioleckii]
MKKFYFGLQKVLDFRDFEKKQAQVELGKAVAEETKIQNSLNEIANARVASVKQANEMHDISSLYNVNQYFRFLDYQKEILLDDLAKAKIVTDQKREVMREAMKKNKKFLKISANIVFRIGKKKIKKLEENDIDDIVTSRFEQK